MYKTILALLIPIFLISSLISSLVYKNNRLGWKLSGTAFILSCIIY